MTQKKISLHTSFSKRQKQHRTVNRDKGWGKGLTEKAVFTRKMLYPTFWGAWLAIFTLYISVKLIPYPLLMKLGKSLGKIIFLSFCNNITFETKDFLNLMIYYLRD